MQRVSGRREDAAGPGGPSAKRVVRRELVRACVDMLAIPVRVPGFLVRRGALRREFRRDLASEAAVEEAPAAALPEAPLRVFVSCAEASGEAHGIELVRELRAEARARSGPEPEFAGLGGERLAAEGVRLLGDPVSRAAMGLDAVASLSFYRALLESVADHLRDGRADVCALVDSPALHVPLGHIAHRYGVPVVHYVTPQYWGWAPWRVKGYRRAVDLALTIQPFEPAWFRRHGVRCAHVGHPQQDVLARVERETPAGGEVERRTLVLLPGSRRSIIARNLPWMLTVAARVRLALPELEVVLPHDRGELREDLERVLAASGAAGWVRLAAGNLHGELARARVALSVSGTILLDLLHHRVPTAVVYRLQNRFLLAVAGRALTVPWFSGVNLIAGRAILPEFLFHGAGPVEEVGDYLLACYKEGEERSRILHGLDEAARRLGPPGAARRAAGHVLATAAELSPSHSSNGVQDPLDAPRGPSR